MHSKWCSGHSLPIEQCGQVYQHTISILSAEILLVIAVKIPTVKSPGRFHGMTPAWRILRHKYKGNLHECLWLYRLYINSPDNM